MKKITYLLLVSACFLGGCHSGNNPSNTTTPAVDTAKINAAPQQPIDTSVKNGQVIRHYPNGVMKERSNYKAGRRDGECQSFYENGKLWSDDYFKQGILDGPAIGYYDNGQKKYEGTYTNGKPSGSWKFYANTGKLLRTKQYGIGE